MWSVKRLTVFFVLAVALCGSGTAIADAPYVTVQNANVREQADVNSMRVITFPKGTRVDVTFKEGDWYAVSRDGIHFGYIWSELLAPEDQGSNVTEAPVAQVEPIVEALKTEKSAAKYKVCKKSCADEFLVCIAEKPDIEPEACAETANQCLYSCKDKFQIDESADAPSSPKTSRSRAKELCMSEVSTHEDRIVAMCTTESCIQQEVARLMEECAARYGY